MSTIKILDRDAMNEALLDWASGNTQDPNAEDFRAGWADQRAGKSPRAPQELAARAAYNSAYIAARETPEPALHELAN